MILGFHINWWIICLLWGILYGSVSKVFLKYNIFRHTFVNVIAWIIVMGLIICLQGLAIETFVPKKPVPVDIQDVQVHKIQQPELEPGVLPEQYQDTVAKSLNEMLKEKREQHANE